MFNQVEENIAEKRYFEIYRSVWISFTPVRSTWTTFTRSSDVNKMFLARQILDIFSVQDPIL